MSRYDGGARGFPPFPARRGGRTRGQSWWGRAWVDAVEDLPFDEESLKKGRTVARSGRVGSLALSPGRIGAPVYDGADGPLRTTVTLRVLDDGAWDRLWERTADRPEEADALLAGALPPDLLEAAEDARVGLLPGYGDLEGECDCDTFDHPCAHVSALCYQVSWLLDEDPWLLLLLRGREPAGALAELKSVLLRTVSGADTDDAENDAENDEDGSVAEAAPESDGAARKAGTADAGTHGRRPVSPQPGVPAEAAYAGAVAPLPALPPMPERPADADEPVTGIAADPLERLVADAADRARALLGYTLALSAELAPPLDTWQDTVRLAATHPDPRVPQRLRDACGRPPHELDRAVSAWRQGGAAGLEVLEHRWDPPPQEAARARTAFAAGWEDEELPVLEVHGNRWTLAGRRVQVRQGRDGRWYPYREKSGEWWPAGAPETDPAAALAELLDF